MRKAKSVKKVKCKKCGVGYHPVGIKRHEIACDGEPVRNSREYSRKWYRKNKERANEASKARRAKKLGNLIELPTMLKYCCHCGKPLPNAIVQKG